jgi:hypothetical protein
MRTGQARKRDANESPIVQALRRVGASVIPLSGEGAPDLLVLFRARIFLLEIKTARGRTTAAQFARLAEGWPVTTIRSVDAALQAIGATRS